MQSVETIESQARVFEAENIYLQWLYRRRAMPVRLNLVMVKYQWIAALIFIVMYLGDAYSSPFIGIMYGITGFMIFLLPWVFLFLYFLHYAPLAVETDSRSSLMQFIFISPVPTREIVSNLRRFIFRQHFVMAMPTLVTILVLLGENYHSDGYPHMDMREIFMFIFAVTLGVLIWWFVLESGIASAGLPRIAYSSGLVFLLWIIPVLVAIFWGGYYVGKWHSYLWFVAYGVPHDFYSYDSPLSFLDETGWLMLHYDIFLLASGLITRRLSYRFMELKRSGYWGA